MNHEQTQPLPFLSKFKGRVQTGPALRVFKEAARAAGVDLNLRGGRRMTVPPTARQLALEPWLRLNRKRSTAP